MLAFRLQPSPWGLGARGSKTCGVPAFGSRRYILEALRRCSRRAVRRCVARASRTICPFESAPIRTFVGTTGSSSGAFSAACRRRTVLCARLQLLYASDPRPASVEDLFQTATRRNGRRFSRTTFRTPGRGVCSSESFFNGKTVLARREGAPVCRLLSPSTMARACSPRVAASTGHRHAHV